MPFDAKAFDPPGSGAKPEKWLENPAHLLGLHAVMGTLLDKHYVTCADVIKTFMETANSLIEFLASNVPALRQIPAVSTSPSNLRVILLRRLNVLEFYPDTGSTTQAHGMRLRSTPPSLCPAHTRTPALTLPTPCDTPHTCSRRR